MSNYRAGDVLRLTRIAKKISQEELSEGICSVQTLHRIERGKTRVKKDLYYCLMSKMERVPEKSYAVCVGKDMELLEERIFYEEAMRHYDYKEAEKYLCAIKEKADDNVITKQYLMKAEALMDYYNHKIDAIQMRKNLEQAIKLTLPRYENYIQKEYPFTEQEIMNLMSIANAYCLVKNYEKAIKIYCKLIKTLNMDYIEGLYVIHMKSIIMRNLAITYAEIGDYEKSLVLNGECIEIAKKIDDGKSLSILYADMAWSILRQIEQKERTEKDRAIAQKFLRQSYIIAAARKDKIISDISKMAYQKEF